MAIDALKLENLLCNRLCTQIRIHRRSDGVLMLESPFRFPDGDQYPVYISESPTGSIRLSDRGHTMMHISYEHDVDAFYRGTLAALREQIVREFSIEEIDGVFSLETSPDQIAFALFKLGQALTKIYDLTFLSRKHVTSTFYENLKNVILNLLNEESVDTDYVVPRVPNSEFYPVDYHFKGRGGQHIFLYGVPDQAKARLTTITLYHFVHAELNFESVIVYDDQRKIPWSDLARLTNVAGTAIASLDAEDDLRRKIDQLATGYSN